ncbi:MAG: Hsp70 family protein [Pseudomonadota bacterium]|uniref:Hsp70 family protein n=1 Tax=Rhizorhabdus phycosphaerae TaxID=2711156 RepID=UPI0013ECEAA0|nr:Hsp70 family protein [Rhizorhabdus phycosphaerae]
MIVGIDLGTTNCAIAAWKDGTPTLIPNAMGDVLTPSAVSLCENGELLTGVAARDRQVTHPRHTATSFKRYMGTRQKTKLGPQQEFTAEDLSALVLRGLKADAEAFLGVEVEGAVITVPAYFNDRQRKATRRAGELAGFKVSRLLNEPTAAALAFGIHDRSDREAFLVFDLGGGTFDVSIVEMFEGIVEVRASAGDNRLGGEDFNDCLIDLVSRQDDRWKQLRSSSGNEMGEKLRAAAERTRRALSDTAIASFTVTEGEEAFTCEISERAFEEHAGPLLARLREPVLRSLRDSNIQVSKLSEIVLVGGATRMPVVRRAITRMFGRFPNQSVHPDHAVALGASVQAGLLMGDKALEEIRLSDVCPFTLGVDNAQIDERGRLYEGIFSPIIERNTPIPASRVNYYQTIVDNQRELMFGIYQGESRDVTSNVRLGEIRIPVPPKPAGEVVVECRFSYDSNGLLEIDVSNPETGVTRNLVLTEHDGDGVPPDLAERRKALAALKIHPREEALNIAVSARAARCYESFVGATREAIGRNITLWESALNSQNPRTIAEQRLAFTEWLDSLEGERFL